MRLTTIALLAVAVAACEPPGPSVPDCRRGFTKCGAVCVDVSTSPQHCGACGVDCGGSECSNGKCAAPCDDPGRRRCAGSCVDLSSDEGNCGGCGVTCPDTHKCVASRCSASN